MQALSIKKYFWIGLRKHESLWLWVNGEYAAPAAIYWAQNEPGNSGLDQNCTRIRINSDQKYGRTTVRGDCSNRRIALCEKKYLPNN